MKPTTIKVGPLKYAVKTADHILVQEDGKDVEWMGSCNYDRSIITVSNICSEQVSRTVLMHEIVHAILFDCGFKTQEEHHVDMLANHFVALVRENPKLVAYLQER